MAPYNSGKANGLVDLVQHTSLGYHVAEFEVLPLALFEDIEHRLTVARLMSSLRKSPASLNSLPPSFDAPIQNLVDTFQGSQVMVRSSSELEDGEHSFAGIYTSVKTNPTTEGLTQAILDVYNSMNSTEAIAYRSQHGIKRDRMELVVQRYVPAWVEGVMYTSNPTFPDDLVIEFVNGTETHAIEWDKQQKKIVFESERFPHKYESISKTLIKIGQALEAKNGPKDIEFRMSDDGLHLVQARPITDLTYPEPVTIPSYDSDQLVGSSQVTRGTGAHTLPVVRAHALQDMIPNSLVIQMIDVGTDLSLYLDNLIERDHAHPDGYVLVVDQYEHTVLSNLGMQGTMHTITPHKKGIITLDQESSASHAMTVARESGVFYVGFRGLDADLNSGDVISVYFSGRQAHVFKEQRVAKSIHETHPLVEFSFESDQYSGIKISASQDLGSTPFVDDVVYFLNTYTDNHWTFEYQPGVMGGFMTNDQGESFDVGMGKYTHRSTEYSFNNHEGFEALGKTPIGDDEMNDIRTQYVAYLKKEI